MKFCAKWDMQRLTDSAAEFAEILNQGIDTVSMVNE
jgi:hypothetical protein